jgi:hypothetical protein
VEQLVRPAGSAFAMAGVMIRESLLPNARQATMMLSSDGKAKFRRRVTTGGTTLSDGPSAGSTTLPMWVKLSRRGTAFTAYTSSDGVTWARIFASQTIAMPATVRVGIFALRNGGSGLATARVTNVRIVGPSVSAEPDTEDAD